MEVSKDTVHSRTSLVTLISEDSSPMDSIVTVELTELRLMRTVTLKEHLVLKDLMAELYATSKTLLNFQQICSYVSIQSSVRVQQVIQCTETNRVNSKRTVL